METWPSAQSPLQKLNSDNSSQKTRKSRYQNFLALSTFTRFLYFAPKILPRIVVPFPSSYNIFFTANIKSPFLANTTVFHNYLTSYFKYLTKRN